jgi:hypothetical protein
MDLPTAGSAADDALFGTSVGLWLSLSPLTDLATCDRASPPFEWRQESLSLSGNPVGRAVVLRVFSARSEPSVDAALGRATRALMDRGPPHAARIAVTVLRDRAIALAVSSLTNRDTQDLSSKPRSEDATFASGVGALAAREWLASNDRGFYDDVRSGIQAFLAPRGNVGAAHVAMKRLEP